MILIRQILSMR